MGMPVSPVTLNVVASNRSSFTAMHSFLRPSTAIDLRDCDFAAHSSPKQGDTKRHKMDVITPNLKEKGFYVLYSPKGQKSSGSSTSKQRTESLRRSMKIESTKRAHYKRTTLPT